MDFDTKLYLERAGNELKFAEIAMQISINEDIQTKIIKIDKPETYFSSVITHAYYSIFYTAKAYLIMKGIITKAPEEHKKTYDEFRRLVSQGIVDKELLEFYEDVIIKAEKLLGIFKIEKKKRGEFTYQRIAQANLEPAKESLENAKTFMKHIYDLCA
ncbi:hypothetical protein J4461_03245 [Candidatus Pacearchaeota archaeon]|nr:hypothetical protein [Candidatus Pacearchaeota archaeon]QBM01525.1 hypothetical protein [uncultured archaeon]